MTLETNGYRTAWYPKSDIRKHHNEIFVRITIGLLIFLFGVIAINNTIGGYETGLLSEFQYIPFVLLLLFTIAAILLDTTYYRLHRTIKSYLISLVGLFFCAFVSFSIIQRKSVDHAKTLFEVSNMAGASKVLTFEFKEQNRFRLTEYSQLGQTVFYGKYKRQQDTLIILQSNYSSVIAPLPKRGIIKADTVFWDKYDTMLVEKK